MTKSLAQIEGLELVINGQYRQQVEALRSLARQTTHDARNPVFRMLQILEHMRT